MLSMLLEIAITLIMAKILNFLFEKYNQPGVVGEIIAGIILGPCCLGYFSGSSINLFGQSLFEFNFNLNTPEFKELAFIGIIFLLFIVGLDTDITDLKRSGKSGILTGIFGVFIPFLLGFAVGFAFKLNVLMCMGIGAIFFASSVTVSMRVLSDMDLLSTRVGLTLQMAGIVNDIFGLILFSLIIGQGHPVVYLIKILIFVIFIFIFGYFIIRYSIRRGITRQTTMLVLPFALIICFLFAAFAEDMGLAAIIGAFIAGLIIRKTPQGGMINNYVKTIAYTLFIPLFFVWVGASFNFFSLFASQNFLPYIIFIIVFIIVGLLANPIGGAIGAKISGLGNKDSLSVGFGMMPVMGMALIIVSTEVERGIFGAPSSLLPQQVKTAALLLIIISSLVTPHLLKKSLKTPFISKNNKKERLNKFKFLILDSFSIKKSYGYNPYHMKYPNDYKKPRSFFFHNIKYELPVKSKRLFFSILIGSILIQLFFALRSINYIDKSPILIALASGIIGSCLGYFLLKEYYVRKMKMSLPLFLKN
jgi:Kef-type K+ transport system membrane component KefB